MIAGWSENSEEIKKTIEISENVIEIGDHSFPEYIYNLLTIIVEKDSYAAYYCSEHGFSFLYKDWLVQDHEKLDVSDYIGEYKDSLEWSVETFSLILSFTIDENGTLSMKQYYQLFHTNGLSRSYDDYTLVNGKLVCSYSKEKNNYDEEEHNVKGTDVFVWDQGNLVKESTGKTRYRINHD